MKTILNACLTIINFIANMSPLAKISFPLLIGSLIVISLVKETQYLPKIQHNTNSATFLYDELILQQNLAKSVPTEYAEGAAYVAKFNYKLQRAINLLEPKVEDRSCEDGCVELQTAKEMLENYPLTYTTIGGQEVKTSTPIYEAIGISAWLIFTIAVMGLIIVGVAKAMDINDWLPKTIENNKEK